MPLPVAEWNAALDTIAASLEESLGELDHHCRTCADCTGSDGPVTANVPELDRWEHRLAQWDDRLATAAALVGSIQLALDERQAELTDWRDRHALWRERIEQH